METEDSGGHLPTREGIAAGTAVTATFFLVLFVGPWQEFAIRRATDGSLPVDVASVDGGGGGIYVASLLACFIAFVACVSYRQSVAVPADGYKARLIGSILLSPIVVALVGVIAVVVWSMAQTSDEALGGLVGVMMGSMAWSFFSLFAAIFVGLPAAVGVLAGDKYADLVE